MLSFFDNFSAHFALRGGGGNPLAEEIRSVVFDGFPKVFLFLPRGGPGQRMLNYSTISEVLIIRYQCPDFRKVLFLASAPKSVPQDFCNSCASCDWCAWRIVDLRPLCEGWLEQRPACNCRGNHSVRRAPETEKVFAPSRQLLACHRSDWPGIEWDCWRVWKCLSTPALLCKQKLKKMPNHVV